jgi:hypothetical protein
MYSPFIISENNHVWKQDLDRRAIAFARQLELNAVHHQTLHDPERGTLRYRIGNALANLVRRPSGNRANPIPEVSTAANN